MEDQYKAPSFEEAYAQYYRQMRSLSFKYLRDDSAVDDAVQEIFMRAHTRMHLFRGDSQFSTWLYRLAINQLLTILRNKKYRPQTVSLDDLAIDDGEGVPLERAIKTHDRCLEGTVDRVALVDAIAKLRTTAPGYCTALEMHYFDDLQFNEIAALLNCSEGNAKSQAAKGKQRLAQLLGKRTGL